MLAQVLFELELPHGRVVALAIPEADVGALGELVMPEERAFAAGWAPARQRTWMAGRAALRAALQRSGIACGAVLSDDRGAPALPEGIVGSVSHKERVAVALVGQTVPGARAQRLGIDVELDAPARVDIARKVLTRGELSEVAALSDLERAREVRLRFSLKEALYKALDPFVRRYVGFHEVIARPLEGGLCHVELGLPATDGAFDADARWLRRDGLVLSTARVRQTP